MDEEMVNFATNVMLFSGGAAIACTAAIYTQAQRGAPPVLMSAMSSGLTALTWKYVTDNYITDNSWGAIALTTIATASAIACIPTFR